MHFSHLCDKQHQWWLPEAHWLWLETTVLWIVVVCSFCSDRNSNGFIWKMKTLKIFLLSFHSSACIYQISIPLGVYCFKMLDFKKNSIWVVDLSIIKIFNEFCFGIRTDVWNGPIHCFCTMYLCEVDSQQTIRKWQKLICSEKRWDAVCPALQTFSYSLCM